MVKCMGCNYRDIREDLIVEQRLEKNKVARWISEAKAHRHSEEQVQGSET